MKSEMAESLAQTFARYAEDAEFRQWRESRVGGYRYVYAYQDDNVWKFTVEEWWRFVTRTIRSKGAYTLPLSNHLPNGLRKSVDSGASKTIRRVNLQHWTLTDWKDELDAI